MTLRRGSARGPSDYQVDMLIRCALRERVAGAAPSPAVWRRVQSSAQRTGGFWQAWNRLAYHFEAVGVYISGSEAAVQPREVWGNKLGGAPFVWSDYHWSRLTRSQVLRLVA